ncbi:hypothetical protein CTL2C_328 [Chlamydia trachomatis L2c]|nr:hypothetical protein CTL2C_328 [Chlamydia trachomatis L2c]
MKNLLTTCLQIGITFCYKQFKQAVNKVMNIIFTAFSLETTML